MGETRRASAFIEKDRTDRPAMECRHRKSDGSTHAFYLVEFPLFDDDGNRMIAGLPRFCRQAVETVRKDDAGGEAFPYIGGDIAFDDGFITLWLMFFRRRNAVSQVPSLVKNKRPVVSLSNRPTGNKRLPRYRRGKRSRTVCDTLSSVADTTPAAYRA